MQIKLLCIGKTNESYLKTGIGEYCKRLKNYTKFEILEIENLKKRKNLSEQEIKVKEGSLILEKIGNSDLLILLDENGQMFNSLTFADYINQVMISGKKNVFFVIGGAYGFSDEVYKRANKKVSLSKMTFSHQLIRLIFAEQIYRAMTILRNEPYHHQ